MALTLNDGLELERPRRLKSSVPSMDFTQLSTNLDEVILPVPRKALDSVTALRDTGEIIGTILVLILEAAIPLRSGALFGVVQSIIPTAAKPVVASEYVRISNREALKKFANP
eukprot:1394602-Amorphochlora_amoeboformis.AAC.1